MPEHVSVRISFNIVIAALAAAWLAACGGSKSVTATTVSGSGGAAIPTRSTATTVTTVTKTATASRSSATTGTGVTPCRAAGMALSFLGQQGATGHGELGFALHNTGSKSCSTIGYPGIQFLDRAGGDLPTTPTHTTHDFFGVSRLAPLVVAGGHSVSFRLGVTHGVGSGAGCTTAYALGVIPPNDTQALKVVIPDGAAECTTATVSPLQPGTSAYR